MPDHQIIRVPLGVDPIKIIYRGNLSDFHVMDMGELGESLRGLSKILGVCASIAATEDSKEHRDALAVRIRVEAVQPGSFLLVALAEFAGQSVIQSEGLKALFKMVCDYMFAVLSAKKDSEMTSEERESWLQSLKTQGEQQLESQRVAATHVEAILAKVLDHAAKLAGPARETVRPIGGSCQEIAVEAVPGQIIAWGEEEKRNILAPPRSSTSKLQEYQVLISELDLQARSGKVSIEGIEERIKAKIVDPEFEGPRNPYTQAMDQQVPLSVVAKAAYKDGQIDTLFISDTA